MELKPPAQWITSTKAAMIEIGRDRTKTGQNAGSQRVTPQAKIKFATSKPSGSLMKAKNVNPLRTEES